MLQELEILVDHDIQNYATRLLFNYKPSMEDSTYCFHLPLEVHLQHRSHISKDKVRELIDYLNLYLIGLDSPFPDGVEEVEPDWDSQRGWKAPVDTNPSRE
jgi:hypothetical protein